MIEIYVAYPQALAEMLDAFHIDIHRQYETESLRDKYNELLNEISN